MKIENDYEGKRAFVHMRTGGTYAGLIVYVRNGTMEMLVEGRKVFLQMAMISSLEIIDY